MKAFAALAALTLGIAPVQASGQIAPAISKFCSAVKTANGMGLSVAPGTAGMYKVLSHTEGLTANDYKMVWLLAENNDSSTCRGIF